MPRISSIQARGVRRLRAARRGCLSRAMREVGDELTSGARLAAAVRGGERGRARAVDRAEGVGGAGAGLGPNGQWAGWPGLARRARPWAELVSVQAGECVRVFCFCFFKQNTKVVIINSKELIKTPQ